MENPVVFGLSTGAFLLNIGLIVAAGLFLARKFTNFNPEDTILAGVYDFLGKYRIHLSFLLATTATLGSLYMSNQIELLGFAIGNGWEPCRMCWIQRIFMYPLSLIFGIALFFKKNDAQDYALPLAMIGVPIAFYHGLMQRFQQFESAGCSVTAVSCSTEYTFHYGFITIPILALTAFLWIIILNWRFTE